MYAEEYRNKTKNSIAFATSYIRISAQKYQNSIQSEDNWTVCELDFQIKDQTFFLLRTGLRNSISWKLGFYNGKIIEQEYLRCESGKMTFDCSVFQKGNVFNQSLFFVCPSKCYTKNACNF
jgi:hypothetical protein